MRSRLRCSREAIRVLRGESKRLRLFPKKSTELELGEWIVKVMQVICAIPPEQIVGPRPGWVSLTFKAVIEQSGVNFHIDQYQGLPTGLSNAEIYQALQVPT